MKNQTNLIGKRIDVNPNDEYWVGDTLPKVVEIESNNAILVYDTVCEAASDAKDQSLCYGASYMNIPIQEAIQKAIQ